MNDFAKHRSQKKTLDSMAEKKKTLFLPVPVIDITENVWSLMPWKIYGYRKIYSKKLKYL